MNLGILQKIVIFVIALISIGCVANKQSGEIGHESTKTACYSQITQIPNTIIHFEFKSSSVNREEHETLNSYARRLTATGAILYINGYTDKQGSKKYNYILSVQRANAVKEYLISRGVDPKQLVARGYGEENLKYAGSNFSLESENRRVEIKNVPEQ